jgi:hypothetical protein
MNISFSELLDSSLVNLQQGASIGLLEILISISITLLCSSIIVFTYKNTYQGVLYQKSFAITIVMASIVTTSVIMVISGNLVLSLGMVGALSIVRFRAAIKDPLDIMYIFWAITIGIANGVAYIKVSLTTTIIISIVMFLMSKRTFTEKPSVYLLIVKHNGKNKKDIANIVKLNFKKSQIKSQSIKGDNYESIFEVRGGDSEQAIKLLERIDGIEISLISYENNV